MAQGILLQSGTNEMELLVFRVGDTAYGVNVAKVRELIQRVPTVSIPHAPTAVEGSFKLREGVLSLINLGTYLNTPLDTRTEGLIIIIELNETRCGILVDAVEMIHRLRWEQVEPPSPFLTQFGAPVTAVAKVGDRVVQILDFETILSELLGVQSVDLESVKAAPSTSPRQNAVVMVADDSPTVRQTVDALLRKMGVGEIILCVDGEDAWQKLQARKEQGLKPVDVLLSDVEMPRVDGLHLTVRIRHDANFADLRVILFSSIVSDETVHKSKSVGATAQVAKSDTKGLIEALDKCLERPEAAGA